jgi:hypothetical protein
LASGVSSGFLPLLRYHVILLAFCHSSNFLSIILTLVIPPTSGSSLEFYHFSRILSFSGMLFVVLTVPILHLLFVQLSLVPPTSCLSSYILPSLWHILSFFWHPVVLSALCHLPSVFFPAYCRSSSFLSFLQQPNSSVVRPFFYLASCRSAIFCHSPRFL